MTIGEDGVADGSAAGDVPVTPIGRLEGGIAIRSNMAALCLSIASFMILSETRSALMAWNLCSNAYAPMSCCSFHSSTGLGIEASSMWFSMSSQVSTRGM